MRRLPPESSNSPIHRQRDGRVLVRLALVFACGLLLAAGFVRATAHHVVAVRQGYRSEELRQERARLLEEQRQLMLALNEAAAPARLEQAAREIGLAPARASQLQPTAALNSDRVSGQTRTSSPQPVYSSVNLVSTAMRTR